MKQGFTNQWAVDPSDSLENSELGSSISAIASDTELAPEVRASRLRLLDKAPQSPVDSKNIDDADTLKQNLSDSFEQFIKSSADLTDAYGNITIQLDTLREELNRTKQERLEELERKEILSSRLENLLNVLPSGVIVLDGNGCIQTLNPYGREIFDRIELGERWIDVINREFSPRADDGHEISLKNGKRVSVETRGLENEPGQILSISDVTENRQLQEKLSRHRRLSEMGKMLASLAHQIRTPLSAAILYASHLDNEKIELQTRARYLQKLKGRLSCISQQIKDILVFVRGGVELNEAISCEALFSYLRAECEVILKASHSSMEIDGADDKQIIFVNRTALLGALSNLVENSIHAVISHALIKVKVKEKYDRLIITISDNGPGIAEEIQDKVLDPFFTTKSTGTGLGLPVVQATITAHGGGISIDQNAQQGASFIIDLPLAR